MTELKKSDSYYRKLCMIQQGLIPDQSEVKKRLGNNLTKVFFESCLPVLKPYLGLVPIMEGPEEDLWVSPSDLLIGKVRLKPPLTDKYIKSLTHEGILEIGAVVEKKVRKNFDDEKAKALAENEQMLKVIAEKEKREAMKKVRKEERDKHERMVDQLQREFQEQLKEALERLEDKMEIEKMAAVEEGKKEVERVMQSKLEVAVLETVQRLTEQFANELIKQSECLHEHFWYHVKKEKHKLKKAVDEERAQCKETLETLRTDLQCENIANVMYVLAKERRRCACEKLALEKNFLAKLEQLEKELEERGEELQKTISELERMGKKVRAREEALFEIIKQFQKFIYFVLRAVPTQAEYLLNVEKLMIFELTTTVMQTKPKYFTSENGSTSRSSSSSDSGTYKSLDAEDYHSCDNLIEYLPSAHTLSSDEDVPMFTYGDNFYVREDFRNMISQGLEISRSNPLWSFELKEAAEHSKNEEDTPSLEVCVRGRDKSSLSVQFPRDLSSAEEKLLQSHLYNYPPDANVVIIEKPLTMFAPEPAQEYVQPVQSSTKDDLEEDDTRQISRLSLAKDSLILASQKVRMSVQDIKEEGSTIKPVDSLIISTRRSIESRLSETKALSRSTSKLETHVDSLEIIRTKERVPSRTCTTGLEKRKMVSKSIQVESPTKVVKISHIEIIPDKISHRQNSVVFYSKPNIIQTDSYTEALQTATDMEEKPLKKASFESKDEVEIIGDRSSTAHTDTQDEFTAKRVNSFITIFRENPSLRQLFTAAINN